MRKFSNTRYNLFAIKLAITEWLTAPLRWLDITSWIKLYRIYREQRNAYFIALCRINALEESLYDCQRRALCAERDLAKWQLEAMTLAKEVSNK